MRRVLLRIDKFRECHIIRDRYGVTSLLVLTVIVSMLPVYSDVGVPSRGVTASIASAGSELVNFISQ